MTCLGLNGTISLEIPLPCAGFLFEPNASCNRSTANPASATTATVTKTIHRRRITLLSESFSPVCLSVAGETRNDHLVDQSFHRALGEWPVGHDGPEDQVAG